MKAPAAATRLRARHLLVLFSFLAMVVLPSAGTAWYLWTRAVDQYASTVGFSVRREEISTPADLLGGITGLSSSSSSDTDILYEFLQSQKLVSDIENEIGLSRMWSLPENDPVFSHDPAGPIEDLVKYWERMVSIHYDGGTGLIEVRALAFTREDANRIAQVLFERSSEMINDLSSIAREDALRYAREDLALAEERLRNTRAAVTEFRNRNQMVDPESDLQSQAGLLGTLQAQLAQQLIEIDLLRDTTGPTDPRLTQATRRAEVIEERIAIERRKLGIGTDTGVNQVYAGLVGDYERLAVDREIAERTYASALAAYHPARAAARRKTRYLAAHIQPTLAETAQFPRRLSILGVIALFLTLAWSIAVLIGYSVKDRR